MVRERKESSSTSSPTSRPRATSRARVDGETIQLSQPPTLKKQEKHTIEVVVGPAHGEGLRQAPADRLRGDRARTVRRHGRARLRGPPEDDPERERMYSEHLY
ncbi:hypothetical protein, partial [Streptomyces nodosus]|uniref:hypothetical protein n=1 Tax=Streptomyces nodosus TaxID=40318 RepID=UPI00387F5BED